jgi:signal transduction histidine kinase
MAGKGQLKILARSDKEQIYLQFVDNGSGISKEDIAKIFDAYYSTKTEGHGLGMMIVQRIMRQHGGHIAVESQIDVGTAITLQFPQPHIRTRMLESKD